MPYAKGVNPGYAYTVVHTKVSMRSAPVSIAASMHVRSQAGTTGCNAHIICERDASTDTLPYARSLASASIHVYTQDD